MASWGLVSWLECGRMDLKLVMGDSMQLVLSGFGISSSSHL